MPDTVIQKIENPSFMAFLLDSGIVHLQMKEIEDYTVEIVKEQIRVLRELGQGEKMPILITFTSYLPPNEESMKYSISEEATVYNKAIAIVVDSLAHRLGGNFYLNFYKPIVPTKLFNSQEKAMTWLAQYR